MTNKVRITSIVAFAGLAAGAAAQDSVGLTGGLPGDALNAYTGVQRADYVVDLADLTTSWGNVYGIAPLAKTAQTDAAAFFNNLGSAWGISQTQIVANNFPAAQYAEWTTAGPGINPAINSSPNIIAAPGVDPIQFAAVGADFGGPSNNIVSAIVAFDPANPGRLYVSRVLAATNKATAAAPSNGAFGAGSIDADGNTYFRADNFGAGVGNAFTGQNIFRVDALARSGAVNALGNSGPADAGATDWLVVNSGTTHSTPSAIPADVAGRPVYVGATSASTYAFESAPLTVSNSGAHIVGTATDHRGVASYSPNAWVANSVGTFSVIGRNGSDATQSILFWDVDANGNLLRATELVQPLAVTDPADAYSLPFGIQSLGEFDHYHSQTAFNGGNGPTAIGFRPADSRGLAAGVTYNADLGNTDPFNSIIVADFDPSNPGATANWTLVSWVDDSGLNGKPIKDGPGGTVIGNLVTLDLVTGGQPLGPSVSAPFIDGLGNIWFVHAIVQPKVDQNGQPFDDFDSGLIRAVYDPTTGGYELELVLEIGQVITGLNSGVPYQVQFFGVADSNSVTSGTLYSNGGMQQTFANEPTAGMDQASTKSTGGVLLGAEIVYDADNDGDFEDPTSSGGDPLSGDEAYQVLLFIGHKGETTPACPADLTGSSDPNDPTYAMPDGDADGDDFFFYLDAFSTGNLAVCDITGSSDPNNPTFGNPDGDCDGDDFFFYLDLFSQGCP
ncbi:MAG: GC-type dockerin domain-anchored protein [Phycisphaerales bacterium JB037]